mmetsp:Transcript_9957/g.30529  ORF Transcript_9957/g.30529 Transcript_9957/m.30529 type:complete len:273 (+) Transcript_9957:2984-3802(+)
MRRCKSSLVTWHKVPIAKLSCSISSRRHRCRSARRAVMRPSCPTMSTHAGYSVARATNGGTGHARCTSTASTRIIGRSTAGVAESTRSYPTRCKSSYSTTMLRSSPKFQWASSSRSRSETTWPTPRSSASQSRSASSHRFCRHRTRRSGLLNTSRLLVRTIPRSSRTSRKPYSRFRNARGSTCACSPSTFKSTALTVPSPTKIGSTFPTSTRSAISSRSLRGTVRRSTMRYWSPICSGLACSASSTCISGLSRQKAAMSTSFSRDLTSNANQ